MVKIGQMSVKNVVCTTASGHPQGSSCGARSSGGGLDFLPQRRGNLGNAAMIFAARATFKKGGCEDFKVFSPTSLPRGL
jgi:hypothetical protein